MADLVGATKDFASLTPNTTSPPRIRDVQHIPHGNSKQEQAASEEAISKISTNITAEPNLLSPQPTVPVVSFPKMSRLGTNVVSLFLALSLLVVLVDANFPLNGCPHGYRQAVRQKIWSTKDVSVGTYPGYAVTYLAGTTDGSSMVVRCLPLSTMVIAAESLYT